MMARRSLVAGTFALAASGADAARGLPGSGRLTFNVLRNGSQIGTNILDFRRNSNALEVRSDLKLAVSFGPITLFRYRLTAAEIWRDDRFAEIDVSTDNDGEPLHVSAKRDATGIVVTSSKLGRQTMAADVQPLMHWNIANMSAPLFNPQDGKPMQLTARALGADQVTLASGARIAASHFMLSGEATIEDWYDDNNLWAALRAVAKDGSIVEYKRVG